MNIDVDIEGKMMEIQKVGIVGAGIMGNGIAQACASAGLDVIMVDINQAAIDKGIESISSSLERLVKKEKLTSEEKTTILSKVTTSLDYADLKNLDLVIEAATEAVR